MGKSCKHLKYCKYLKVQLCTIIHIYNGTVTGEDVFTAGECSFWQVCVWTWRVVRRCTEENVLLTSGVEGKLVLLVIIIIIVLKTPAYQDVRQI